MFPLIKIKRFHYNINGHYYGLRVDPDAKIFCGKDIFTAAVSYKNGITDKYEFKTFREALDFLIIKAVKPYFQY